MSSLIELDLTGNFIHTLAPNTFASLLNLKNLALARNNLNTFDKYSFYGLKQIEQLDLSENMIDSFDEIKHMNWMTQLKLLVLNENPKLVIHGKDCEIISKQLKVHLENLTCLTSLFIDSTINLNVYFYDRKAAIKFYYSLSQLDSIKNQCFKLN